MLAAPYQPSSLVGGDIGEPAELVAVADATLVHRAVVAQVDRARQVGREPSGRAGGERPVAVGRRSGQVRRAEARARGGRGPVAKGELVGDGHARERDRRASTVRASADRDADAQPPRPQRGAAEQPPGQPEAR